MGPLAEFGGPRPLCLKKGREQNRTEQKLAALPAHTKVRVIFETFVSVRVCVSMCTCMCGVAKGHVCESLTRKCIAYLAIKVHSRKKPHQGCVPAGRRGGRGLPGPCWAECPSAGPRFFKWRRRFLNLSDGAHRSFPGAAGVWPFLPGHRPVCFCVARGRVPTEPGTPGHQSVPCTEQPPGSCPGPNHRGAAWQSRGETLELKPRREPDSGSFLFSTSAGCPPPPSFRVSRRDDRARVLLLLAGGSASPAFVLGAKPGTERPPWRAEPTEGGGAVAAASNPRDSVPSAVSHLRFLSEFPIAYRYLGQLIHPAAQGVDQSQGWPE